MLIFKLLKNVSFCVLVVDKHSDIYFFSFSGLKNLSGEQLVFLYKLFRRVSINTIMNIFFFYYNAVSSIFVVYQFVDFVVEFNLIHEINCSSAFYLQITYYIDKNIVFNVFSKLLFLILNIYIFQCFCL